MCVCVRNRVVSDNAVLRNVCTDGAHVLTTCNEAVDGKLTRFRLRAFTRRTAQGGEKFQNGKPTGGIGCCDAWMAERIH